MIENLLADPFFFPIALAAMYTIVQGLKRFNVLGSEPSNRLQAIAAGIVAVVIVVVTSVISGDLQADFSEGVWLGLKNLAVTAGSLWGVVTLVYHRLKDYWETTEEG